MENNFNEEILNELTKMPYKAQVAIHWMVENIKELTVLLNGKMPKNIEEKLKTAWESENYYLHVLLLIKKVDNKNLKK